MTSDFLDLLHASVQSSAHTMEIVIADRGATARPLHGVLPIKISCEERDGRYDVMLSASLGRPRPEYDSHVDTLLLDANHLGLGTSGCTLGRDRQHGDVSICARLPLDLLDCTALDHALQAFHVVAVDWHGDIHRGPDALRRH